MIPAGSSPEVLQRGIARAFCCVRRDRAQLVPLLFFLFFFSFLFSSLIFYRFTVCVIAAALLSSVLSLSSLPLLLLGEPDR